MSMFRSDKSQVIAGEWFLPSNEKTRIDGTLNLVPGERSILELNGTFESALKGWRQKQRILGKTREGPVTLLNCYYIHESYKNNVPLAKYACDWALVGVHAEEHSNLSFNVAYVEFYGLYEYLSLTGLRFVGMTTVEAWQIEYKKPDDIVFSLADNINGRIFFEGLVNSDLTEVNIRERIVTKLDFFDGVNLDHVLHSVTSIRSLFALLSNRMCFPKRIILKIPESEKLIHLVYSNIFLNKDYSSKRRDLVPFTQIYQDFPRIIKKWHSKSELLKSAIALRINGFYFDTSYSEERFLDGVRALESFHRQTRSNEVFEREEYKNLINDIKQQLNLNEQYRKWLNNRLGFGNEPTLKARLHDLFGELPEKATNLIAKDLDELIRKIRDTRNYYTHRSAKLENKVLSKKQLVQTTIALEALLSFLILKEIGIEEDDIIDNIVSSGLLERVNDL